jgi:thermosome
MTGQLEKSQLTGTPIFILKEGSQRTKGKDAQHNNIMAAKAVAAAIRTTLGPKGMDKMLVNSIGDVIITNDGATILKEMDIEHPAAKMIVEVAKTQDDEVGDGTTTAAIIAGDLLKNSEELLELNVHPTVIINGYNLASIKCKKILQTLARSVDIKDRDLLLKIASTSITGRISELSKDIFINLAVDAILSVIDIENDKNIIDIDNIKMEKIAGGSLDLSQLIKGIIIDKEKFHSGMPNKVTGAVLLYDGALEIKKTEAKAEISIELPSQLKLFVDNEEDRLRYMVDKIINIGANVVFVQQGIADILGDYLAKAGIYCISRTDKKDMERLARATGAKIVSTLKETNKSDLGSVCVVEEKKIGIKNMTMVRECANAKAISILIRGGEKHVLDEAERILHDALSVVKVALEDKKIVAGGGSPEVELAMILREYSATLPGREQLAVNKFAEAIEIIPRSLAENGGFDPIDKLVEMRSQHEKGIKTAGLNVFTGNVVDMWEEGVIEPCRIKMQAINSATEAANMILSIDDVITGKKGGEMPQAPGPEMG